MSCRGESRSTHRERCSFCEKHKDQLRRLITGPGVSICDECIDLCVEICVEAGVEFDALPGLRMPTPKELGFSPIFNDLSVEQVSNQCFYLGPFEDPFNLIYQDHVAACLSDIGVSVKRADEIFSVEVIIEDIWREINAASFIVADLTTKNANVLYEVGMAHTVGRPVIIITQDINDVPFDLRHRRCIVMTTLRAAAQGSRRL